MLGRLICGDDCLSQVVRNHELTNKFRYQIQAKDYSEGITWGKICSKRVFHTDNYYSYQKSYLSKTSAGLFNTIIRLGKNDVKFLFDKKFVESRDDLNDFKPNTSLSVIKYIPMTLFENGSDDELAEFLAGMFDSDGCIRPKHSEMFICLDSQVKNRKHPLAYKQIELLKLLELRNKLPKIIKVVIIHNDKSQRQAEIYFSKVKNLIKNTLTKKDKNVLGIKINIYLSCNVLNPSNRLPWAFWTDYVVKKLIRKDKRVKFSEFINPRKMYFSYPKLSVDVEKFCDSLAKRINSDGRIMIKRPKYPQCEIRVKISDSAKAKEYKNEMERMLGCEANILKERGSCFLDFYISMKNYHVFKNFILPKLNNSRWELFKFINSLERRINTYKHKLGLQNPVMPSPAERLIVGSKEKI